MQIISKFLHHSDTLLVEIDGTSSLFPDFALYGYDMTFFIIDTAAWKFIVVTICDMHQTHIVAILDYDANGQAFRVHDIGILLAEGSGEKVIGGIDVESVER